MFAKARAWLVDRFALQPIYDTVLDRRVPRAPWYSGDGAALMLLFGVQVLTGMVMGLTYSPSPERAYESVIHISERQVFGWFIRGLHYWSAGMMVVVVFFHLCRQVLLGGYKSPREATWLVGVFLFFAVLLMSFTGYLLRWDERAVHGIRVMLHMFYRVPAIGESLAIVVQGGPEMGSPTLSRIFATHVLIVPALMGLLIGYHLYLVIIRGTITHAERRQPVSTAEEQKELYEKEKKSPNEGEDFFPVTAAKSGAMSAFVFGVALVLTLVIGAPRLMPRGNLVAEAMPAEEWWFWWYSGLIALLPPAIAPWFYVLFPIAVFLALLALPFLDRGPARGLRKRPFWAVTVVLIVIAILALTDYRRRSPFTGWPDPNPPPVPPRVTLTEAAEQGRQLFATYGCNSCHPIGGHGPQIGPDFARLETPRSKEELRTYILQPPAGVAMPAYENRLMGEDLDFVVEFCHVAQTFPRR